jgi:hypothetical protein
MELLRQEQVEESSATQNKDGNAEGHVQHSKLSPHTEVCFADTAVARLMKHVLPNGLASQ